MRHMILIDDLNLDQRELLVTRLQAEGFQCGETLKPADFGSAAAMARASKPVRFWNEQGYVKGDVLDFGCGHDNHGFTRWDPFHCPDPGPLLGQYDTVLCTYVLNVQPSDHLITLICCLLSKLVRMSGQVLFAVRDDLEADSSSGRGVQRAKSSADWQKLIGDFFWVEEITTEGFFGYAATPLPAD